MLTFSIVYASMSQKPDIVYTAISLAGLCIAINYGHNIMCSQFPTRSNHCSFEVAGLATCILSRGMFLAHLSRRLIGWP